MQLYKNSKKMPMQCNNPEKIHTFAGCLGEKS